MKHYRKAVLENETLIAEMQFGKNGKTLFTHCGGKVIYVWVGNRKFELVACITKTELDRWIDTLEKNRY